VPRSACRRESSWSGEVFPNGSTRGPLRLFGLSGPFAFYLFHCFHDFFSFPRALWKTIRTTNILKRAFREVRRGTLLPTLYHC
jgi:hypothetical protein